MIDIMTKSETNYEFAVEFESKVLSEMLQNTENPNHRKFIEYLFQNDIRVTPRDDESHIITVDISSQYPEEYSGISRKLSNIQLNLKDSIIAALEFALGVGIPEEPKDLLKLALLATIKLYVLSTVDLSNKECLLLLYLHEKDAYNTPVSEEQIFDDISSDKLEITKNEYNIAIKNLKRLASVIIIFGEVSLNEKIVLRYS